MTYKHDDQPTLQIKYQLFHIDCRIEKGVIMDDDADINEIVFILLQSIRESIVERKEDVSDQMKLFLKLVSDMNLGDPLPFIGDQFIENLTFFLFPSNSTEKIAFFCPQVPDDTSSTL